MKKIQVLFSKFITVPAFTLVILSGNKAFAGSSSIGTIDFSIPGMGDAAAIPSLSGTMLIVLSLLLFIVAFRVSKQKGAKSNKLFVSLLGVLALSSGAGGIKSVSDVNAGLPPQQALTLTLTTATTGSAPIESSVTNYYDNSFGVPATITAINIPVDYSCNVPVSAKDVDFSADTCEVGKVIPDDDQCQLTCYDVSLDGSDERLKNSIKPLVKLKNDIQLYSFKYNTDKTKTYVGAMAQDLLKDPRYKHSVKKMSNDYYGVNYRSLGLKMISLEQWQKSSNAIYSD